MTVLTCDIIHRSDTKRFTFTDAAYPFRNISRGAVNGRSWPDSERLTVAQGKPVRWRIINPTISDHAMHLHGFFYAITGVGDSERFARYAPGQERQVVTEHIDTGQTFDMTWVPERPGNWLFHCHMTGHMSTETAPELSGLDGPNVPTLHGESEMHSGMYGLVLSVQVLPAAPLRGDRLDSSIPARRLRLDVRQRTASRYTPAGALSFSRASAGC